jgi:transposase
LAKAYLARLCQSDQEIAQTAKLIQSETPMLRERQGEQLDSWLKLVKEQGVAELQSFAQGLERDYEDVKSGFALQ